MMQQIKQATVNYQLHISQMGVIKNIKGIGVFITVIFSSIVFSCGVLCKFCVFFFFYSRAAVSVVFSTLLSCSGFIMCSLFASCTFI